MKQRYLAGSILFAGICIALPSFANSKPKTSTRLSEACVQCAFNGGGCRTCIGGGFALYCETFNCGLCGTEGECSGGIQSAKPSIQTVSTQSVANIRDEEPLRISSDVIRNIGAVHPRFAITLAEMNVYGISPGERRLYWTPKTFSPADVENFINKEANSKYFVKYNREVRRLNRLIQKGELADIVYRVSTKLTEEGSWSIKLQVESGLAAASLVKDPAYTTLEIEASSTQSVQGVSAERPQKKFTWQIQ